MDTVVDDPIPELPVCPRCGLVLTDELRTEMVYCTVCQRGDFDAGRGIPEHIEADAILIVHAYASET